MRVAALVALVAAGTVVVLAVGVPTIGEIRGWVAAAGWAGPLVFAAVYVAVTLTPVPASVLTVAAGLLFGVPVGLIVVWVAAMTGAVGGFTLSRLLGRDVVARVDSERLRRLDAMLGRCGLLTVIGARVVPLLPFGAFNYACGLTAVRARDYVLGTAIGIVPGAAAYVTVGAYGTEPGLVPLLAVGGLLVLALVGVVVNRRRRLDSVAVEGGVQTGRQPSVAVRYVDGERGTEAETFSARL